jgi:Ca2+-transporting ATPase
MVTKKTSKFQDIFKLSADETLKLMGSSNDGLTQADARRRLAEFGKNIINHKKEAGWLHILAGQFNNFLSYIIIAAAVITYILKDYSDSLFILFALVVNAGVGFYQEYKVSNILKELKKYITYEVKVVREGSAVIIDSSEVVPGDIILLDAGERIPADARLVQARDLFIDESILSGESAPVSKNIAPLQTIAGPFDMVNHVFMGTFVISGKGVAVVLATGQETEFGKITASLSGVEKEQTPLQKKLVYLGKILGWIVLGLAALVVAIGSITGKSMQEIFVAAVALSVSSITEGLLPSITVVLVLGMKRILRKGGLVKKLAATETLGGVTVICTDKTGTLTEGKMQLVRIVTGKEELFSFSGQVAPDQQPDEAGHVLALRMAVMATGGFIENPDDELNQWRMRGSPTEQAIVLSAMIAGVDRRVLDGEQKELHSVAFNEERKYSVSIRDRQGETVQYVLGAPERVFAVSSHYHDAGGPQPLTKDRQVLLGNTLDELTRMGLRVIGCGYRSFGRGKFSDGEISAVSDIVFVGFIAFKDPLRPDVVQTIKQSKGAGVAIVLMSGDHPLTVKAIAHECGIIDGGDNEVLTGQDMELLPDNALMAKVKQGCVFARVMPHQKLRVIRLLKEQGEIVAMIGDGVNDAPAIKMADVGVAVASGTDVAKEVSDIVLLQNNLGILVRAIEEGRIIFKNIRRIIAYLVGTMFTESFLFIGSLALGLPIPLIPAQILYINIVEDTLPSIALTFEKKDREVMKDPPRSPKESILSAKIKRLVLASAVVFSVPLLIFFVFMNAYSVWSLEEIRTAVFMLLSLDSLLLTFSMRDYHKSVLRRDIFGNHLLNISVLIGITLTMLAVYVPELGSYLKMVPLSAAHFWMMLFFVFAKLFIIEMIKLRIYQKAQETQLAA